MSRHLAHLREQLPSCHPLHNDVFHVFSFAKLLWEANGQVHISTCPFDLLLGSDEWKVWQISSNVSLAYVPDDTAPKNELWTRWGSAHRVCGPIIIFRWFNHIKSPEEGCGLLRHELRRKGLLRP